MGNIETIKDSKGERKEKLNLNVKRLFLIYSDTKLSAVEILKQLLKKFSHISFYILSEKHYSENPHKIRKITVYLEFNRKMKISDYSNIDLVEGDKILYGFCQSVRSKTSTLSSIKTDSVYITNILEKDLEMELDKQKIQLEIKKFQCSSNKNSEELFLNISKILKIEKNIDKGN